MTAEYDVYLPVCVRVKVNERGDVVAVDWARVDWEGTPWAPAPYIFDRQAETWASHHGDEESVLWRVQNWAEIAVTEMVL